MNTDILKKYLAYLLELELNVYEQGKAIERMGVCVSGLGVRKTIERSYIPPSNNRVGKYCGKTALIGLGLGVIFAIIESFAMDEGFGWKIFSLMIFTVVFAVGGLAIGCAVGLVIGLIKKAIDSANRSRQIEENEKGYKYRVQEEEERVINEEYQKRILIREMEAVKEQLEKSKAVLYKAYSFNVIHRDYWNVYAVSSFYSYFIKGKTYSLTFDPKTGDQGAYNIYDNECRLDKIIMSTEEILYNIDRISDTQNGLANGLRNANRRVDMLFGKINSFMNNTPDQLQQIDRCQDVVVYNSEIAKRSAEILAWMECLR